MKHIHFSIVFLLVGLLLAGCSDDVNYSPAEMLKSAQVYFSSSTPKQVNMKPGETQFEVTLNRIKTEEAMQVNIVSQVDGTNYYTIPSQVTFPEGKAEAKIVITVDENIPFDDFSNITLSIAEADYTTPYGFSSVTFRAGTPAPWKKLGKALYRDDLVTAWYGVDFDEWEVEIEENEITPGLYRLVYPYDGKYVNNEAGDWKTDKTYYLEINATDPDRVFIERQELGMAWSYGMFSIWSMADYDMQHGKSADDVAAAGEFGTLKDGVITFPASQLLMQMAGYQNGDWCYGNGSGMFRVVLPGYTAADYSAEAQFLGQVSTASGDEALIGITLGKDVKSAKVALFENNFQEDMVQKIINEEVEAKEVTASGEVRLPVTKTGSYTAVVVAYDKGEAVGNGHTQFSFVLSGDKAPVWTAIGTGSYTYTQMLEGTDKGLALSQVGEGSLYKISDYLMGTDFIFTWDKATNECYVGEQSIEYNFEKDGKQYPVYVADIPTWQEDESFRASYPSYYDPDTKTFHFNVAYYCALGGFGYGEETFQVEFSAGAKAQKVRKMSARLGIDRGRKPTKNLKVKVNKERVAARKAKRLIAK